MENLDSFKDSYGNVVKPGDLVAYNRSGELWRGTFVKITSTKVSYGGRNYPKHKYHIQGIDSKGMPESKNSVVKNSSSILKL